MSQLREIFSVRWSVFLLGPAGCGKTAVWRTLLRAQQLLGEKTVYKPINPKVCPFLQLRSRLQLPEQRRTRVLYECVLYAVMQTERSNEATLHATPALCDVCQSDMQAVTRNELYGYVHPSTREWREGLISTTFRDMSNNKINKHQWILLDGDIDAEWIEVSSKPGC